MRGAEPARHFLFRYDHYCMSIVRCVSQASTRSLPSAPSCFPITMIIAVCRISDHDLVCWYSTKDAYGAPHSSQVSATSISAQVEVARRQANTIQLTFRTRIY